MILPVSKLPAVWPADRLSDDHTVEDRIHNAVLAERERCIAIADELKGVPWDNSHVAEEISMRIRSGK